MRQCALGSWAGLSGQLQRFCQQSGGGLQHRLCSPRLSGLDGQRRREPRPWRHSGQWRLRVVSNRLERESEACGRFCACHGYRNGLGASKIQQIVGQSIHGCCRRRGVWRQLQADCRPMRKCELAHLHLARLACSIQRQSTRKRSRLHVPIRPRSLPLACLSLV